MIRFALVCDHGHGFESWFRDNAAYADQAGAGLVTCPHCGSAKVEKSIMAPHVARSDKERHAGPVAPPATPAAPADGAGTAMTMLDPADLAMRALLREFRRHVRIGRPLRRRRGRIRRPTPPRLPHRQRTHRDHAENCRPEPPARRATLPP
jgi:hypothetical protein